MTNAQQRGSNHGPATPTRLLTGLLALGAAVGVLGADRAHAKIIEKVVDRPYEFSFEGRCDFGTEDTADDIRVVETYVGTETYKVRAKPDGTIFFQGHFDASATYLNPDTSRSFTSVRKTYEHDIKVVGVDPTTNEATVLTSRHDTLLVYDEQGDLDGRSSQLAQFTLIVDLDTMDVTFGEFLKYNGPSTGGDFCDDMQRFTVD